MPAAINEDVNSFKQAFQQILLNKIQQKCNKIRKQAICSMGFKQKEQCDGKQEDDVSIQQKCGNKSFKKSMKTIDEGDEYQQQDEHDKCCCKDKQRCCSDNQDSMQDPEQEDQDSEQDDQDSMQDSEYEDQESDEQQENPKKQLEERMQAAKKLRNRKRCAKESKESQQAVEQSISNLKKTTRPFGRKSK